MKELQKLFYINLDHRKDRLFFCEHQLNSVDYPVDRVDAVQHDDGTIGCALSHLKILYQIYESRKDGYYVILEDDFFFTQFIDFEREIDMMKKYGAHFYCFSYTSAETENINYHYVQILKSFSTCAYMLHNSFVPIFIHHFEKAITDGKPIDLQWHQIQQDFVCIGPSNPTIYQLPSYSDITNNHTHYQQHPYILINPNLENVSEFLFQFVNALHLCFRFRKFLFVLHWQHFNDYFSMPFYPHKSLDKKTQRLFEISAKTKLSPEKNYILEKSSNPNQIILSPDILYTFHKLLKPVTPTKQNTFLIGIHMYFTQYPYFDLTATSYYDSCIEKIKTFQKPYHVKIYTNQKSNVPKHFSQQYTTIETNDLEFIQYSSTCDVLFLSNHPLSWFGGHVNQIPNKKIYYSDIFYEKRQSKNLTYPKDWEIIPSYDYTFVVFEPFLETINLSDYPILKKNVPVYIYTKDISAFKKLSEMENIFVRPLSHLTSKLYHNFPEVPPEILVEKDNIQCFYHVSNENTFKTPFFVLSNLNDLKNITLSPFLKIKKRLNKSKIKEIKSLYHQHNLSIKIGTPSSILKYCQKFYSTIIDTHNIYHHDTTETFDIIFDSYPSFDITKFKLNQKRGTILLCIIFVLILFCIIR